MFSLFTEEEGLAFEERLKERLTSGAFEAWADEVCGANIKEHGVTAHFVFKKPE